MSFFLRPLTVEYLSVVLVIFAVVSPSESSAQPKVRQLDVAIGVWGEILA